MKTTDMYEDLACFPTDIRIPLNHLSQREREQLRAILGNEEVLFRAQCYVEMIRDNPIHSDAKKWALLARAEIAAVRSLLKSSPPAAPVQAEGEG